MNAAGRHMTLKVINDKGIIISQQTKLNNIFTATGHFKVNTGKLNLNPGVYTIIMSYAGNTKDKYNPCEATSTLTVTP